MIREMSDNIKEIDIQRRLEAETGGGHETCLAGIPDIVTQKKLIEIKRWKDWKHALGQVMAYREFFPNREAKIHFFGYKPRNAQKLEVIYKILRKYDIRVTEENYENNTGSKQTNECDINVINEEINKHYAEYKTYLQSVIELYFNGSLLSQKSENLPCEIKSESLSINVSIPISSLEQIIKKYDETKAPSTANQYNNPSVAKESSSNRKIISSTVIKHSNDGETIKETITTSNISTSTTIYRTSNNISDPAQVNLKEFIESKCTIDKDLSILSNRLWDQYKSYLRLHYPNVSTNLSLRKFNKWMKNLYPEIAIRSKKHGLTFLGLDFGKIDKEDKIRQKQINRQISNKKYYLKNKAKLI